MLDRDPDAGRAADNFSPVALTSVLVIVATGAFAAWRQVGWSVDAFRDTSFGRILLVKIAVFIGLLAPGRVEPEHRARGAGRWR